jgi:hypothetical protein
MLLGKQYAAGNVDAEAAEGAADRTGKPQPAAGIEKENQAFPNLIVLRSGPEAGPLTDGQSFSISHSADGAIDMESYGDGFNRLTSGCGPACDCGYVASKDHARGMRNLRQADGRGEAGTGCGGR